MKRNYPEYVEGRIDLSGTTLGEWMSDHALSARGLAKRLYITEQFIYRLTGHRNSGTVYGPVLKLPPADVLYMISRETGISIGTLSEDAIRIDMERQNGRNAA